MALVIEALSSKQEALNSNSSNDKDNIGSFN
jgi:hypothetical protein